MSARDNITGPVVGIDLGTTYSVISIYRNGKTEVIANDQGNRSTPSVVGFNGSEKTVGDASRNQSAMNPTNTIYEIKRLMGRKWDDPKVKEFMNKVPFKVVNKNDKPCVEVEYMGETKIFTPEEISAMILADLKKTAETYLGCEVKHAVITTPAYFNENARQATKDSSIIAGLNVIRLINEPTAATIAYGFDKKGDTEKTLICLDAGGGTYDISILTMENGVYEVKAVNGDCFLGGADFDNYLVDFCKDEFKRQSNIDITNNLRAIRRLRTVCERAKRTLSSTNMADIEVESLAEGQDFNFKISRAKFESLCAPLFKKHIDLIEPALKDAKISKSQVDEIILVGGTTRIPKLRQMFSEFFNGKTLCTEVNPDEAVSIGAAIQAAALAGQQDEKLEKLLIVDVTPLSLGIETAGGIMTKIIERNSTIPTTKTKIFTTYEDNQPAVDIQIYEGERPLSKDCNRLGNFRVSGLPPARRATLKINVAMHLNGDGILEVTATEESTGKNANIKITNDTNRLSKAEVDRMIREAEKYKQADELILKKREAINKLESLISQSKDMMTESMKEKISSEDQDTIKNKCDETDTWLKNNQDASLEEYEQQQKSLQEVVYGIVGKTQTQQETSSSNGPQVDECD